MLPSWADFMGKQLSQDKGRNYETPNFSIPQYRWCHADAGEEGNSFTQWNSLHHVLWVLQTILYLTANVPMAGTTFSPVFSLFSGLGLLGAASLRQQADFHPGGEEWEECIDVAKQTTALCVFQRPDMGWSEPWDNHIGCSEYSSTAHLYDIITFTCTRYETRSFKVL